MDYSFNADIARLYGVDEAVFIHNIYWWIRKNEANRRHYYDGKNWTYNTLDAFASLFPFWTKRQVERIVRNLRDNGAIYIGNYNSQKFDRTQWYALSETVTSIYANGYRETHEPLQGNTQMVTTIPDSKPDSKPDICPSPDGGLSINDLFEKTYKAYPLKKGKADAKNPYRLYLTSGKEIGRTKYRFNHQQIYIAVSQYAIECEDKEPQFIKHFSTFLNSALPDYVEQTKPEYEAFMQEKYGNGWQGVKLKYD